MHFNLTFKTPKILSIQHLVSQLWNSHSCELKKKVKFKLYYASYKKKIASQYIYAIFIVISAGVMTVWSK